MRAQAASNVHAPTRQYFHNPRQTDRSAKMAVDMIQCLINLCQFNDRHGVFVQRLYFHFYSRDALHSAVFAVKRCTSVRLSHARIVSKQLDLS